MQHLRRIFRRDKTTETPGIKETGQLAKGIIYHATGRLNQTPAFTHNLICGRTATIADATQIDHGANSHVVGAILRAEQRQQFKVAADILFNKPPNYAIDFTVRPDIPRTAQPAILLRRTLRIAVPGMDDVAIAREICKSIVATATGLQYDSLPREFRDINSLFLLQKSGYPTSQFWHSVVIYAYCRLVHKDAFAGKRR